MDVVAVVGDVLIFLTLVAAVITVWFAADSTRAARDTVQPMRDMASNLTTTATKLTEMATSLATTVQALKDMQADMTTTATTLKDMATDLAATVATLKDMQGNLTATAATMKANLELAERGRREDRLVHRLEQYERIVAAVTTIRRAYLTQSIAEREQWTRDGQAMLRAAVAPLPRDELPSCRTLSTDTVVSGLPMQGWDKAVIEIDEAVYNTRTELDELLKSAGLEPSEP